MTAGDALMGLERLAELWSDRFGVACLQGGLFVAGVWVLCRLMPRLPVNARRWLWWIACLKLTLGLLWTSPVALPILPPAPPLMPLTSFAVPTLEKPDLEPLPRSVPETLPAPLSASAPLSTFVPAPPPAAAPRLPSLRAWLFALWLACVCIGAAVMLQQSRRLRRLLRNARPLRVEAVDALVQKLAAAFGQRPPGLKESTEAESPFVAGYRRPVVVLPNGFTHSLPEDELRAALAHELAHVRRHDLWFGLLPALMQALFFFFPFAWLAYREWTTAREVACDAAAMEATGVSSARYAALLVKIAAAGRQKAYIGAVGATTEYRILKRRLRMLPHLPQERWPLVLAPVALALLFLIPWRATARPWTAPFPVAATALRQPAPALRSDTTAGPFVPQTRKGVPTGGSHPLSTLENRPIKETPMKHQPNRIVRHALAASLFATLGGVPIVRAQEPSKPDTLPAASVPAARQEKASAAVSAKASAQQRQAERAAKLDMLRAQQDQITAEQKRHQARVEALIAEQQRIAADADVAAARTPQEAEKIRAEKAAKVNQLLQERDKVAAEQKYHQAHIEALIAAQRKITADTDVAAALSPQAAEKRQKELAAEKDLLQYERDKVVVEQKHHQARIEALVAQQHKLAHDADVDAARSPQAAEKIRAEITAKVDQIRQERNKVVVEQKHHQARVEALIAQQHQIARDADVAEALAPQAARKLQGSRAAQIDMLLKRQERAEAELRDLRARIEALRKDQERVTPPKNSPTTEPKRSPARKGVRVTPAEVIIETRPAQDSTRRRDTTPEVRIEATPTSEPKRETPVKKER